MTAVLGNPVTDSEESPVGAATVRCNAATAASAVAVETSWPRPGRAWLLAISAMVIATSGWAGSRLATPGTTPQDAPLPAGIEGFAEMYVAAILGGADARESDLAAFVVESPPSSAHESGRNVARVGAIGVRPIGPDYWVVTVAAEVDHSGGAGNDRSDMEFYEVAVAGGDGLLATGPPLPIPAPAPNAAYGIHRDLLTPADEATTAFMHDFLDAYLINGRRLPRLVTPDSGITAVVTLPVAAIEVTDVTVDAPANFTWATAAAVATTTAGTDLAITVTTRLVTRHGGLRVAELLPGPPPIARTAE